MEYVWTSILKILPQGSTSGLILLSRKSRAFTFLTNWVDSQADSVENSAIIAMYNYWLHRMRPLITSTQSPKEPVLFFAADRVGI